MSVKYEKVEFEHAWQAAKAVCEGEMIYAKSDDDFIEMTSQILAMEYCTEGFCFYRKVKPNWWEKLDGTDENGVLVKTNNNVCRLVTSVLFDRSIMYAYEGSNAFTTSAEPIPSAQIEQWLKNAKEIEND